MGIYINNLTINLENIEMEIDMLKILFIGICTFYTFIKITNTSKNSKRKLIMANLLIVIISILLTFIKYNSNSNSFFTIICMILLLSWVNSSFSKSNIGYSIFVTIISLSVNYILFFIAIFIVFLVNLLLQINNDFINLTLMEIIHILLIFIIFKIKKLKYGIRYLQKTSKDEYFGILILNICVIILYSIIIFSNLELLLSTRTLYFAFIIFAIIMFITIQKSLQLYYKQKLLIQDLEETKKELDEKKKEVEELEKENLEFSKTSHTLAHKQRILEHKIEEISSKSKTEKVLNEEEENNIKATVQEISKKLYTDVKEVELYKTEIPEIDDILRYTQSECTKNNIEFNVQIRGNIYKMINNIIPKEELQILIADHVKNAIIAINHSENINRSILIQIGKIMGNYGLYIYDSGIEFEKETLENLGKKPSTTHAEDGGTGMGFMNTFDTLRKYKASLEIEEIGNPSKDNYTKILKIKFDEKEEYKVKSYRENIVKKYNL